MSKVQFADAFCSDLDRTKETASYILPRLPGVSTNSISILRNKCSLIGVTYTPLLREKGGGVIEGMPLTTSYLQAKEKGIPYREYRPDKGESWIDVMNRGQDFLDNVANTYIFSVKSPPEAPAVKEEVKKPPIKKGTSVSESKSASMLHGKAEIPKLLKKKSEGNTKSCSPRILVITHGGFIMEFLNLLRAMKGLGPSEKNSAKNTAIYIFKVECKACKGVCSGICANAIKRELAIKILKENDNSHLETHGLGVAKKEAKKVVGGNGLLKKIV